MVTVFLWLLAVSELDQQPHVADHIEQIILDHAMRRITGRVVQKDVARMDETLRRRMKYLQHLPVCIQFEVVRFDFATPTTGGDEAVVVV